jgi:hypothetical protein
MNDDLKQLRKKIDGSDLFMESFQIKKIRRPKKNIPSWSLNNEETQKLLLGAFPKLKTNEKQRRSAGRWGLIIHLFYRANLTSREVSEAVGCTYVAVNAILRSISRRASGRISKHRGVTIEQNRKKKKPG